MSNPDLKFSRSLFVYGDDTTKVLVGEASDLELPPGSWPPAFILVADDSTKAEERYVFHHAEQNKGECHACIYMPDGKVPSKLNPEIHILND